MSSNKESIVLPEGNEAEDERPETSEQTSSGTVSRKLMLGEGEIKDTDIRSGKVIASSSSKADVAASGQKKLTKIAPGTQPDVSKGERLTKQRKDVYSIKFGERLKGNESRTKWCSSNDVGDASICRKKEQSAREDSLSVDEVDSAKSTSPFALFARKTTCEVTVKEHALETCLRTSELIPSGDGRKEELDDRETDLGQKEDPLVAKEELDDRETDLGQKEDPLVAKKKVATPEKELSASDDNYSEDGVDREIVPSRQGNRLEEDVARDMQRINEELEHGYVLEQGYRLKFDKVMQIWNASGRAIVPSRMMMKFWMEEALSSAENNGNTRTKDPADGFSDTSSDTTEKRSANPSKGHRSDHHPTPNKILLSMMNQFINSTEVNVYNASISLLVFRPANDDGGAEDIQLAHPTSDLIMDEPPEPPQHEPVDPGNMGLVLRQGPIMEPVPFGMPEVCVGCGAEIALEHDCPMRQNRAFVDEDPMAQDNGRGF